MLPVLVAVRQAKKRRLDRLLSYEKFEQDDNQRRMDPMKDQLRDRNEFCAKRFEVSVAGANNKHSNGQPQELRAVCRYEFFNLFLKHRYLNSCIL